MIKHSLIIKVVLAHSLLAMNSKASRADLASVCLALVFEFVFKLSRHVCTEQSSCFFILICTFLIVLYSYVANLLQEFPSEF